MCWQHRLSILNGTKFHEWTSNLSNQQTKASIQVVRRVSSPSSKWALEENVIYKQTKVTSNNIALSAIWFDSTDKRRREDKTIREEINQLSFLSLLARIGWMNDVAEHVFRYQKIRHGKQMIEWIINKRKAHLEVHVRFSVDGQGQMATLMVHAVLIWKSFIVLLI